MKGFNIENIALNFATLGPLGRSAFGRFLAPLLAIPLVFFGRHVYLLSKDLFYIPMIILVIATIWAVSFAFENLPLERTDQIILPLIPGMAESLLHLPMAPKIIIICFALFSLINILLERIVDHFSEDPTEKIKIDQSLQDQEELDQTEVYALPPGRGKNLYEILMLPIGAGVITSLLVHAAMLLVKKL